MWAGISPPSWWAAGGCAVVPPLVASPENKKNKKIVKHRYIRYLLVKNNCKSGLAKSRSETWLRKIVGRLRE
jgi:hypothetical protein